MRDKYNLNLLPQGVTEEMLEYGADLICWIINLIKMYLLKVYNVYVLDGSLKHRSLVLIKS